MKRRGFVRGLILAPAAQAALSAQQNRTPQTPAAPAAAQQPVPMRGAQGPARLKVTAADLTSESPRLFFSKDQFETLEKMATVMMPPMKGNPGAIEAQAPLFLDFLISVSPFDRQNLYQNGLDQLNEQAKQKFQKNFAQLDASQVGTILKPLMVARPWNLDWPKDPLQDFVAQAHEDIRKATTNSREYAEASANSGRRFNRGSQSTGFYWKPIDPVVGD
jgi:Gluconate 2-dehydrogenase subunit 3